VAITRLSASVHGVIDVAGTPKTVDVQTVAVRVANTVAVGARNAAGFGITIFRVVCVNSAGALDRTLHRFHPSRRVGRRIEVRRGEGGHVETCDRATQHRRGRRYLTELTMVAAALN